MLNLDNADWPPPLPKTETTRTDALLALHAAHVALIHAANVLVARYGRGKVTPKLLSTAGLIADHWMPAIHAEDGPSQ
jgi:hypothetical protein